MIAKIIKGSGFRGVCNYLFADKETPSEFRGHVIASNMAGNSPRSLAKEFGFLRKLRPTLGKAVFHCSLSLPPEDPLLTDQTWGEIVEEFRREMGFTDAPFFAIRHQESEHIHIVASRIDTSGKVVSDAKDFQRAESILRRLEKKYGLRTIPSSHNKEKKMMTTQQADSHTSNQARALPGIECGDELTVRERRNYKRQLLDEDYRAQLMEIFSPHVRHVSKSHRGLLLPFSNGGRLYDEGDTIKAYESTMKEAAQRAIALAVAKGWVAIIIHGTPEFVQEAIRQGIAAGISIMPQNPQQEQILAEILSEDGGSVESATPPTLHLKTHNVLSRLDTQRKARERDTTPPRSSMRLP